MKPTLDVILCTPEKLDQGALSLIERTIRECLKEFPDFCEGSIMLNGIDHFFTYKVLGSVVNVNVVERSLAERLLNEHKLSTHEPFNPLPDAERPH
jgi:hypothetical protein